MLTQIKTLLPNSSQFYGLAPRLESAAISLQESSITQSLCIFVPTASMYVLFQDLAHALQAPLAAVPKAVHALVYLAGEEQADHFAQFIEFFLGHDVSQQL